MNRVSLLLIALVAGGFFVSVPLVEAARAPRILYLGDSLSIGAFGQTFDQSMRSSGFEVHTVVAGGASPYYWLKSYQSLPCTIGFWEKSPQSERRVGYVRAVPKLEDLLDSHGPSVVVVQTGINLYATLRSKRRTKAENISEVTSLIEQMCYSIAKSGAVSYWVLPPHSHEQRYPKSLQDELSSIMRNVVDRYEGKVFESQKVTRFDDPYPATDGIHYGPEDARGWAQKVSLDFNDFMKVSPLRSVPAIVRALPIQTPQSSSSVGYSSMKTNKASSSQPDELDLVLKLVEKSELQNLNELPYSNALGLYEYEVIDDRLGNYPYDKIRVAHGIVFGRKYTGAATREIGTSIAMRVVPLSKYKTLSTWEMVDQLRMNLELPIYTPKLD
ncbi:MAG: hypothetical protein P1U58_08180 [Verrucomicrobiales bacterium]|nr:hypothetical protein [Verrucomicrobiales bacterium]